MNTLSRADQRKSPREKVSAEISIRIVSSALDIVSQDMVNTQSYSARMCDISYGGMCIASNESFTPDTMVDILISSVPTSLAKKRYTGVIVWYAKDETNESMIYGIEFISSWIRSKFYRKQLWRY